MADCPSKEMLSGYVCGSATPEEVRRVEDHLSDCAACCQWCESASSGDDELLVQVRRVLDSDGMGPHTPSSEVRLQDAGAPPAPIEGYRTLRELGRGGMGVVYLAVQESTKRQVALKVLLEGPFASPKSRRRFEREVELAALLDHPGIATVLDSGLLRGRYYFAMRFVDGVRLDRYVLEHKTPLRDTLALFARTCDAVAYAHQHGVIHRDLKPSNILVTAGGDPQILDFGLAKAAGPAGEDDPTRLMLSQPGELMGTLAYMSPEQTTGRHEDVDIRSDVYALGVILYRLLVGHHPYPITGGVREVLHNIAEVEPARPSSLRGDLNDDLDTILLRALAKDRQRRYASVDQFADDIRAYLGGRPIAAKRDQLGYVIGKAISRHRMATVAATVLLCTAGVALSATLRQRNLWHQSLATDITARLVQAPAESLNLLAQAPGAVHSRVAAAVGAGVVSVAYTDRITGARGALLLDPVSFWASIDGGPLWQHGEWLEVCALPADIITPLTPELQRLAIQGSDKQRYVANCLLGCTGTARGVDKESWQKRIASEPHMGVAAAARWAAGQGRENQAYPGVVDEISRLRFVRVPATESYQRGASTDDPDHFADEAIVDAPQPIPAFQLSATEVTWSAFQPFIREAAATEVFGANARFAMDRHVAALSEGDRPDAAVGMVTLNAARAYCAWLSERGTIASPRRTYRLPTEEEWEYAARGGNSSRFCFGDDARYARYFAHCDGRALDGISPRWPVTARHMPNFHGLFDMHGGLWEWTDSRYPAELMDSPELTTLVLATVGCFDPGNALVPIETSLGATNLSTEFYVIFQIRTHAPEAQESDFATTALLPPGATQRVRFLDLLGDPCPERVDLRVFLYERIDADVPIGLDPDEEVLPDPIASGEIRDLPACDLQVVETYTVVNWDAPRGQARIKIAQDTLIEQAIVAADLFPNVDAAWEVSGVDAALPGPPIEPAPSNAIAGRVALIDGTPLADIGVLLRTRFRVRLDDDIAANDPDAGFGEPIAVTESDADGGFSFPRPAGAYRVELFSDHFAFRPAIIDLETPSERIVVIAEPLP